MFDTLSYLAGLVDGEGSVGWFSTGKRTSRRFAIKIKMTDERVIDWCLGTFGGKKAANTPGHVRWKPQWTWTIQGTKALELYEELQPLLKIKNRHWGKNEGAE